MKYSNAPNSWQPTSQAIEWQRGNLYPRKRNGLSSSQDSCALRANVNIFRGNLKVVVDRARTKSQNVLRHYRIGITHPVHSGYLELEEEENEKEQMFRPITLLSARDTLHHARGGRAC